MFKTVTDYGTNQGKGMRNDNRLSDFNKIKL